MRYFFEISYDGTNYHGWQKQPNSKTVQETIEKCFSTIVKQKIDIVGAGRTDAGVHAREMIAHFDYSCDFNPTKLSYQLNSFLPNDIAISNIFEVNKDAHARFSAISRSYDYIISFKKNPLLFNRVYHLNKKLDIDQLNDASNILFSHDDFSSFSKSKTDVKTFNCKIHHAKWKLDGDLLIFSIKANRFLRNMVRAIVGTLIEVGQNNIDPESFNQIILKKDRKFAGYSVPASGLYLSQIEYNKTEILNVSK